MKKLFQKLNEFFSSMILIIFFSIKSRQPDFQKPKIMEHQSSQKSE